MRPVTTDGPIASGWANGANDINNVTMKEDDTNGRTMVYLTRTG